MLVLLGALGFFLVILLSVMVHEAGHFVTARRFGMKATQFFVGFGPTLWSRTKGETEYGVKAIPAGGYVKIVGMTPLEELEPGDEDRAFYKQPAGRRTIVLGAGSFMHFILAIVLVYLGLVSFGRIDTADPPVVGNVSRCVPAEADGTCRDDGAQPAPALGRLQPGDRIVSVDGVPVETWKDAVVAIRSAPGRTARLGVERDDRLLTVTLTPVPVQRPGLDGKGPETTVGAIGVGQGKAYRDYGPLDAVGATFDTIGEMTKATVTVFTEKLGTVTKLYSDERDPEGFAGIVGVSRVGGEIAASQNIPTRDKISGWILLAAGLNLFVGLFNLLPLLPLDGGHLAVLAFEQARDRVRRWSGYRGELQRVDLNKLMPITYAVALVLISFTVLILGADIVNPIRLEQ